MQHCLGLPSPGEPCKAGTGWGDRLFVPGWCLGGLAPCAWSQVPQGLQLEEPGLFLTQPCLTIHCVKLKKATEEPGVQQGELRPPAAFSSGG